jgi:hypothetical protein
MLLQYGRQSNSKQQEFSEVNGVNNLDNPENYGATLFYSPLGY